MKNESQQVTLYQEIKFFKQKILDKKMHAHYFFLIRMLQFFGISPLVSEEKFLNIIEESLKGGVSVVQLREKKAETLDFYNLALKVKEITQKYKNS